MNKEFWKAALIRAVRTMAQTALPMIPVSITIVQVDWLVVLGVCATSGLISILTSLATGLPETEVCEND